MPVMEVVALETDVKDEGVMSCFIGMLFEAGFSLREVRLELSLVPDGDLFINRWLWSDET